MGRGSALSTDSPGSEGNTLTTTIIDIDRTPANLDDLLELIAPETEIIILRKGKRLARLVPATPPDHRLGYLNPGSIEVTGDFDATLPEEFWTGNG
jgi:antitoxin (DNA-binding transcriptional repressor) of toxin-antitoxin stability system